MVTFNHKGDFSKVSKFLDGAMKNLRIMELESMAKEGVENLRASTPVRTGTTAQSWYYTIERDSKKVVLDFHNENIKQGCNIALLLQYGHGTGTGGWVRGQDYINPAVQPIFDKIEEKAWKEVTER